MDTNSSFTIPDQTCQRFSLSEIHLATNNFDESLVIGRGGFGKVYKCSSRILSVNEVAIKRLHSMSNQGSCEFEAEIQVLSKLRHGNLVSLIGYCNEEKEMSLIYEFMPNGTLEDHLHKADVNLSWLERLNICIGAARALNYLHTGTSTKLGVIHRDVKTSNILLDANFDAKISDFGLAKVSPINQKITYVNTRVKGTFGYMDPFYFYSGKLTRKSDVYAFGVVLFEVLSGRQAVDPTIDEDQWSLAAWAQDQIKDGKLNQIIDDRLIGQASKKCLKEFASIACRCIRYEPKHRPTMAEVVVMLESILSKEKERVDFGFYERGFISTVRNLFKIKTDMMPARADTSKSKTSIFRTFSFNGNNYKGWLDEWTYARAEYGGGLEVSRKRKIEMSKVDLKPEKFIHPNLVKLLGYRLSEKESSCVYEFIPDTSLDKLLYIGGSTSLSWVARLKIAVGAAGGLYFLHQTRQRPAYSQFKTSCVLVDMDYNAWLSDYEVDNSVVELDLYSFRTDAPYAAPEWFRLQADSFDGLFPRPRVGSEVKSEVYAFGVLLLEILTGMKVLDYSRPEGKERLVKWATPLLVDEVKLKMIIDPQLQVNNQPPKGAFELALLVSKCLHKTTDERPSMEEILHVLSQCYLDETKTQ